MLLTAQPLLNAQPVKQHDYTFVQYFSDIETGGGYISIILRYTYTACYHPWPQVLHTVYVLFNWPMQSKLVQSENEYMAHVHSVSHTG